MMNTNTTLSLDCGIPYVGAHLPIWRELGWWLEWLDLRRSPTCRCAGVPRGDGSMVVVVPGFLGSDKGISELQHWLTRAGYRVRGSGIDRNVDCPDVALADLIGAAESAAEVAGDRVRLIGHSLGGTLARAAAVRRPDLISQVITLASPISEIVAHPLVLTVARFIQGHLPPPSQSPRQHRDHVHGGACACDTLDALSQPFPDDVARAAIYTRSDGVVDWRSAMDADPAFNHEVHGTHVGLIVNRQVYQEIGRLLSSEGEQGSRAA
jgi:pimeloyl-ACP methyl ester carboxylesterase